MKKLLAAVTAASLITGGLALPAFAEEKSDDIVILYTNDVHCGIDDAIGYDGLMLYKREMEAAHKHVILADAGDSIQGGSAGTLTKGAAITELMNYVGYDVAVPGNHEFDYSVETLKKRGEELDCGYVCCNFASVGSLEPFFDPYKILDLGETQIAFVGVVTPETFFKSTPVYFKNDDGEFIYTFCEQEKDMLYDVVQQSIDSARNEGADYVILLAHLGEEDVTEGWSSIDVAANTTGVDAIIDAHSHTVDPGMTVTNKNGESLTITSTGTKLNNIGKMTISEEGIKTELISSVPEPEGFDEASWTEADDREGRYVDTAANLKIHEIEAEMDDILSKKIASSDFGLYMYDPETGDRIARNHETNLGDFCADAFREICGTDVGILNGGSLRKDIKAGDITFGDILNVYPYSNKVCAGRMSGQTLLDMLEFGSSVYPEQLGGFLQVSGVEYTIDYSVPSSVESNEFGEYTGVSGEYRVKNVKVGGKPLDPDKIYTVASTNYLLQNVGDGYVFGDKCEVYYESKELDVELLERFITDKLGGIIPEEYKEVYGQGRIHFVDGVEEDSSQPQEDSSLPEDESSQPQDESSQPQDESSAAESSQAEESTAPADSKSSDTNPKTGLEATAAVLLVAAIAVSYAACRRKK